MGRWTDLDSDEQRLPEGFTRVGYDADTQIYTFRDSSGAFWESESGNSYGNLWRVGQRPQRSAAQIEAQDAQLKKGNKDAVRMMLPFALLVFVFLLLLFKLVNGGSDSNSVSNKLDQQVHCAEGAHQVQVEKGSSCWEIAEGYSLGVDELLGLEGNEKIDCDVLKPGQPLCVPN